MTIAGKSQIVPLALRLHDAKVARAHGLTRLLQFGSSRLRRIGWHTKSYLPILGIVLLTLGSLLALQCHWLYRRLMPMPSTKKQWLKTQAEAIEQPFVE